MKNLFFKVDPFTVSLVRSVILEKSSSIDANCDLYSESAKLVASFSKYNTCNAPYRKLKRSVERPLIFNFSNEAAYKAIEDSFFKENDDWTGFLSVT